MKKRDENGSPQVIGNQLERKFISVETQIGNKLKKQLNNVKEKEKEIKKWEDC